MTAPLQPPMLRYIIHIGACYGRLDVVTDHRIDAGQKMPDWIRTKKINFIEFVGYIKPPKGEGFKPYNTVVDRRT